MKKLYFLSISLLVCFLAQVSFAQTTTFTFNGTVGLGSSGINGTPQSYVVPAGVTSIGVDMYGGSGGWPCCSWTSSGGPLALGGRVQCTMNVTPGTTLYVYVGGAGANNLNSGTQCPGGWNGGGIGGAVGSSFCAGGGGASDIRTSTSGSYATSVLVVAGAGGGGGDFGPVGGAGGGITGGTGINYSTMTTTGGACGGGQTGPSCTTGSGLGTQGQGGSCVCYSDGGGGGGWWGGNGGTAGDGAGGGGSSYPATPNSVVTAITHTQGYSAATGNGQVSITVLCASPGTIVGAPSVCVSSTTTLSDPTSVTGGVWSSSNTAVATINSATGVVTGIAPGTATITYTVPNPCGPLATYSIVVNPLPGSITGSTTVCIGTSSTLSSSTTGGTWAITGTAASIGSATGILTGISVGGASVTYTLPTGCTATTPVTVNGAPAAIGGPSSVCPGNNIVLTDATSGGTWSSSNTALATINPTTGVVTGVAGGFPIITYSAGSGCYTSTVLTVYSMNPIVGVLGMCTLGATTTLSDATAGGTWSSSNTGIATIGSTSGLLTAVSYGVTTISYTVGSTGCVATAVEGISSTSGGTYSMTGGGSYCTGGGGAPVGLGGSTSGISYLLFNGSGPLPPAVLGIGFPISFGNYPAGTYYVVANYGSSCATTMTGSTVITANPLPTQFTVSGGGAFCSGGAGVHVYLNTSTIGVNYQLMLGTTPIGSPVSGTSSVLDFGLQTTLGTYSVVGTNVTTGCVNNMANTVTVINNPLPTLFAVTGTGGYCAGGTGVTVGLSSSSVGVNYQLYYNGSATTTIVAGTGSALSFGPQTAAGTYTVVGTNTTTSCSSNMAGSAVVTVNAIPNVYTVTGGGSYCSGTAGPHIGINGSTVGVNYLLYTGTTLVGTFPGTGAALDFGAITTAGSYTVVAINATTGCTINMTGSASIIVNPLPTTFSVTGGGSYCAGGPGVHVGLSGSVVGTNYSLLLGTTIVGGASGTGAAIDFGYQTGAGTYTVFATNSLTGCINNMTGSVTIVINALPSLFTVNGGGAYCAGASGVHIGLTGSTSGVNYQLFLGGVVSGSVVAGTGAAIDFGFRTLAGSYTVVATNASTSCTSNMTGSVSITINPLPTIYTVTGGAPYCTGGTGTLIGLSSSNIGISYQLYNGGGISGLPIAGTGSSLNFGLQTLTGTYTIVATNTTTGCTSTMSGSPVVSLLPLPTAFTVTGSAPSYCAGGAGVHVLLSNSTTGINYQLFNGTTSVGSLVAGNGFALDMGAQTAAGTYTVVATNTATTCTNNMTGSAVITINPLPVAYAVTGGGAYCATGTGVHVGLLASTTGVTYQLYNGPATVGSPVLGTGAAIDFGLMTAPGIYTVVATNATTLCTNNMTGSVTVSVNALPNLHTLTGGGNYCFGTIGSDIGLNGTETGINYQLYVGTTVVGAPVAGTGSAIDFGYQTATGTYTIVATNTTTTCSSNMIGSTVVNVNPLPSLHNVTGGGNYCPSGTGVHVGLNISDVGYSYLLFRGTTLVGSSMTGTGLVLDFGLQTVPGVYTVVATNTTTGCTRTMTGSATVGISALPVVYNVTGGGNYCPSGSGVHVGLNGSNIGITYQLFNGSLPTGITFPGTGLALDFGLITAPGVYTVVAISPSTSCSSNMNGSATVGISALPAVHVVTGGGNYCPGTAGSIIGLNGSDLGVSYQLFNGTLPVGAVVVGTGSPFDFGMHTTGTYSVIATFTGSTCSDAMTGTVTIGTNPLPATYTVLGGGNYCAGSGGAHITLSGSSVGDNYQLFVGSTLAGSVLAGTGASLDFGPQTATGTYTVVATNATTGCVNNMTGSVVIGINALPLTYNVTGGGNYCTGGTGLHVMLSGSNTGITYQLFNGGSTVGGPISGTGFSLDFGIQTGVGVYTVVATNNATGCVNNMTGSVTISTLPLPNIFSVSSTSSNYCAGDAGVDITLTGSNTGVNYQLYRGASPVGSAVPGTGSSIDFGYNTLAGTYTVVAMNTTTTCTRNMASSVTVVINALPVAFTITGGGNYCTGGTGVTVGLSGSTLGILYQLYKGTLPVGPSLAGTGAAISFGPQTAAGVYHVVATNPATTCTNTMSSTVTIGLNNLPTPYNVTGGGNYCAGGTGVAVGLSSSNSGINYQLFNGTTPVGAAIAGSGGALDFGLHTVAGTYTIVATNSATTCSNNMAGSVDVVVNPLPAAYSVTGGGSYCQGGAGVHVGLSNSVSGINYQLFNGSTPVGSFVAGSGGALDFGLQTSAGNYTVVATDATTLCINNMSGSVIVGINPLPIVFNVTGGGNYCASGTGVHITLNGSTVGVNYQLYIGVTPVGSMVAGTGAILDMGLQTTPGTYTIVATNATTSCTRNMAGTTTISVTPLVTPAVSLATTSGDTLCSGNFTTFTATPTNGGSLPTYSWTINGVATPGTGSAYSYIPSNGDVIAVTMTSNAVCTSHPTAVSSLNLNVQDQGTPSVNIAADPGNVVCTGTSVTFNAAPSYGGSAPSYAWMKGTATVGTGSTYTYVPANGDDIHVVMTSNYHCRTANTANSTHIVMQVDVVTVPVVTLSVNPTGKLTPGQTVTITATVSNAGSAPTYQWLVNGLPVSGANTSVFVSSTLANNDSVSCQVTSSGGCAGTLGSAYVKLHFTGVGVQPVVTTGSDITVVPNPSKGIFTVKGNLASATDQELTIEVTDMVGQVVYSNRLMAHNGELNEKIELRNNLANGMYIINLRSGSEHKVIHMVVEQ